MKKQGIFLGMPYNWQWPSWSTIKKRIWDKKTHQVFVPKAFGWGYTINWYELIYRRTKLFALLLLCIALFLASMAWKMSLRY